MNVTLAVPSSRSTTWPYSTADRMDSLAHAESFSLMASPVSPNANRSRRSSSAYSPSSPSSSMG
ncbi:hypothetical protein K933_13646 [Candidatus Halobonum tyrrellensis G22]|uniref:Uncharacterized protein n=1 Tax=Candidatus Halobonum tyrrellensis G22 TaxID=1324957 RepID=V4H9Y6_9EURY|nr:hypothetical protein K933_13646 [Candidatus Halobonum tyrrellensis G22]